jgi:hypothetical protein
LVVGYSGKRRHRRTRSDDGRHRIDLAQGTARTASPWTVEGQIDFIGRALRRGRDQRLSRRTYFVLMTILAALVVVAIVNIASSW